MDDFGGKLRQARERRGISLRQIAASTKISAAALEALERNDISKLPGGIFSRAFVRSYALEVGLDPDETVREFLERFEQEAPPSAQPVPAALPEEELHFQARQQRAVRIAYAVFACLAVLIVGLIFAYRWRAAAKTVPPALPPPPVAASEPAPAVPPNTPPTASASAAGEATPPAASAGQLSLELRTTADCWVSLTVDGKKLFARVMSAGEHESHTVQREAVVDVGDAAAFQYSINGKPGKPLGDKGQVKTLKLTPATASQYTR